MLSLLPRADPPLWPTVVSASSQAAATRDGERPPVIIWDNIPWVELGYVWEKKNYVQCCACFFFFFFWILDVFAYTREHKGQHFHLPSWASIMFLSNRGQSSHILYKCLIVHADIYCALPSVATPNWISYSCLPGSTCLTLICMCRIFFSVYKASKDGYKALEVWKKN